MSNYLNYSKYYSPTALFDKIGEFAKKAGISLIEKVLILYYAAIDPATPIGTKAAIFGALGYFILPVDLIPDFLPGGFVDDGTAIATALKLASDNITPEIERKAKKQLSEWFD